MSICKDNIAPDFYLKPGEVILSDKAAIVSTVLGSCISVTLFNQRLKIGAICHNLLPICKDKHLCSDNCPEAFRYVECTIGRMLKEFSSLGIAEREIEVKLFGGAAMFNLDRIANSAKNVGRQNIETALKILDEYSIKLAASDTGGSQGRKIIFYTHTGEVCLKRLNRTEMKVLSPVIRNERAY
jgi:chemotaxis protein CheD